MAHIQILVDRWGPRIRIRRFFADGLNNNFSSSVAQARKLQSATKWVETLCPWTGLFFRFTGFKKRKYSFSSPIPSMQCSADVRATCRKQQTPQLWMEGTGEGCGFFFSDSCFVLFEYNVSTILSPIVGGWCINFGAIMFPGYYRQTIFFFLELCWKMFPKQRLCAVFGFQEWHINRWSVQFSLCGLQNQSSRRTHSG